MKQIYIDADIINELPLIEVEAIPELLNLVYGTAVKFVHGDFSDPDLGKRPANLKYKYGYSLLHIPRYGEVVDDVITETLLISLTAGLLRQEITNELIIISDDSVLDLIQPVATSCGVKYTRLRMIDIRKLKAPEIEVNS